VTEYLCRRVRPVSEDVWHPVEESSPGRAANEYHVSYDRYDNYCIVDENPTTHTRQLVYFALIEVKDHGQFISRYFYSHIWRRAGVKVPDTVPFAKKLADIASVLGYDGSPEELLAPGWDEEEEEWT